MRTLAPFVVAVASISACCATQRARSGSATPSGGEPTAGRDHRAATAALHALFDAEWERTMRDHPEWASQLGDHRYDDAWTSQSLAAYDSRHDADLAAVNRLEGIDRGDLPTAEQLNYDLFARQYRERISLHRFRRFLIPLSHRGGPQSLHELHEQLPFGRASDYEAWNARLRKIDDYLSETIQLMRAGIVEGRMPPRVIMSRVPAQLGAQLVQSPSASPFFAPYGRMPDTFGTDVRQRLRSAALETIANEVVPAYRAFASFFKQEYLPLTRQSVGVWDTPDGAALYAQLAQHYTTTATTPAQIHTIGLAEVERLRGQMQRIIDDVGFEGSFRDFLAFLRTDPRFYYDDPQDLLAAYRETCKRIDPQLPKLFGRLPRTPYGVTPIPEQVAPDTTTAYYQPPAGDGSRAGMFYVNLYRPEVRPKYEIEVLSVHESVPGHHLQIALAQEHDALPAFRRHTGATAFVEGWGLYSESLGEELGLYDDPYSKFGQLTYEMWRAVRLVVDTGIHQMRWTRQRAIDFFEANAARPKHDIINEIDRYISWPGQALAYKIGQLKILELRKQAQRALGPLFDVRQFHDAVLEQGAVPLDVLERQVEHYIHKAENRG